MMTSTIERERLQLWNGLDAGEAARSVLPCCGSLIWAKQLARQRPLLELESLLEASDRIWEALAEIDWDEAFRSHPRIGELKAVGEATTESLRWSAGEQNSAQSDDALAKAELAAYNEVYEEQFGRTFIVCATGKSSGEMLAILKERLGNSAQRELLEAAEQQRRITHLRLKKWLRGE